MAKNPNLKKANELCEYAPDQVAEFERCMFDPVYFINNYVKIQHPAKGAVSFKLHDFQIRMIRAFQENKYCICLASRQVGKAVHVDTPIPTPNGMVPIKDIHPGMDVYSVDGTVTKVVAESPIFSDHECYRILFDTGEELVVDASHEWTYYKSSHTKLYTATTAELASFSGPIHIPLTGPVHYSGDEPNYSGLLLAYWIARGTFNNRKKPTLLIPADETFRRISNECKSISIDQYCSPTKPYEGDMWCKDGEQLVVASPTLTSMVTHYYPKQASELHIPEEFLRAPISTRASLMANLIAAAGTIGNDRLCSITLRSGRLAADVSDLASGLGYKAVTRRTSKKSDMHTVSFHMTRAILVDVRTCAEYQQSTLPKSAALYGRKIRRITPVPPQPVKCITVAHPSHLYLATRSHIPTHNSTVSSAFLLWYAAFHDDKTVLIASNKNATAMEMIRRIQYMYENLPHWLKPGLAEDGWNKHGIGFDNKSRIISVATSETAGRGLSISLLFLDEFAFVEPNIANEFWMAMAPTLATGGSCIITSTPNGDLNIFAQIWRAAQVQNTAGLGLTQEQMEESARTEGAGSNGFYPIHIRWDEPPGRDQKFLDGEIAKLGLLVVRQEYLCEFISSDPTLIDSLAIAGLQPYVRQPIKEFKGVQFWKEPNSSTQYLVGVDPATGSGLDYTVVVVYEFPSLEMVALWRSNTTSSVDAYSILRNILQMYSRNGSQVYFSIENNGVGEGLISLYENDENSPIGAEFVSESGANTRGFRTTPKTKMRSCLDFKELVEKGAMKIRSALLLNEIKEYVRTGQTYSARLGSTDDIISASLIAIRLLAEIAMYDEEAYAAINSHQFEDWSADEMAFTGNYDEDGEDAPLPFLT